MTAPSARDRILGTAHDLFYRDGIRATGIDSIIRQAGVTKVTFYRHFPSKHALVLAFLDYRHQRWMHWFEEALQRHGATPGGGLGPLIPTLGEWFSKPDFRGCAFINSTAELGEAPDVLALCHSHKQDMQQAIAILLPPGKEQAASAEAAAVIMDGTIFRAQLETTVEARLRTLQSLGLLLKKLQKMAK